jgi:ethanolamine ammonia-lyase small subunit
MKERQVAVDPWHELRKLTAARIALGRAGSSLPTDELLDFGLAHAQARDAVHSRLEPERIAAALVGALGDAIEPPIVVASAAPDASVYLRRPDFGRRLCDEDREILARRFASSPPCHLSIVVADGLSAAAANLHAAPLICSLLPKLLADQWLVAPIVLVRHGRVAIQDEIGQLLQAELSLILLGERPGLGSPDSLGAYFVHAPRIGRTDADRNCLSNIRPAGLPIETAAESLHYLLAESRRRQLSGVNLKDQRDLASNPLASPQNAPTLDAPKGDLPEDS